MQKFILTRNNIFYAQVCAEATYDEALEWIRKNNPAGTMNNWQKKDDGDFTPIKCAEYPERTHYMFCC
jgi:hypothetical protein